MEKNEQNHILIIDDEAHLRNLLQTELQFEGYHVSTLKDAVNLEEYLTYNHIDIVLLDIVLPEINGIEALKKIKKNFSEIEVIILTGNATIETALESMKIGAYDYLTKPYRFNELIAIIEKVREYKKTRYASELLKREIDFKKQVNSPIIQNSPLMKKVIENIMQVAPTDSIVLIEGETGTGKGLIAKAIHDNSMRKKKALLALIVEVFHLKHSIVNFMDTRKELLLELFKKIGLFEVANKGTIFLDEIGDMVNEAQVHLLRSIEEKQIRRLGGIKHIDIDVRIIAATNKSLKKEIEKKTFRDDLYYRLSVFKITLPPLRMRKEDIDPLVKHFIATSKIKKNIANISERAIKELMAYDWPGNIRELRNVIERAIIVSKKPILDINDLSIAPHSKHNILSEISHESCLIPLSEMEKIHITNILKHFNGNRAKSAKLLQISPRSLYDKIHKYDISI